MLYLSRRFINLIHTTFSKIFEKIEIIEIGQYFSISFAVPLLKKKKKKGFILENFQFSDNFPVLSDKLLRKIGCLIKYI